MTWFRTINKNGLPAAYERFEEPPPPRTKDVNDRRKDAWEEPVLRIPDVEGTYQQYLIVRNDHIIRKVLSIKETLREWLKCCNGDPEDLTGRQ